MRAGLVLALGIHVPVLGIHVLVLGIHVPILGIHKGYPYGVGISDNLERAECECFVRLGFMQVVTQFAIDGTHKIEEEGV